MKKNGGMSKGEVELVLRHMGLEMGRKVESALRFKEGECMP